jgi:hypothetical protein
LKGPEMSDPKREGFPTRKEPVHKEPIPEEPVHEEPVHEEPIPEEPIPESIYHIGQTVLIHDEVLGDTQGEIINVEYERYQKIYSVEVKLSDERVVTVIDPEII